MIKKLIIILVAVLFITGCNKIEEKKDYSKYKFTDVTWVRSTESDSETLTFRSDGSFGYSCGCGNPVNDSDLCDSYTYNEKTNEIKFECFEKTKDMVTKVKIISVTDEKLELDFNNEIRIFKKQNKKEGH